jgi:hypothetical protein
VRIASHRSFLKAAGQVGTVGQQEIRGVATTHYHATVDIARYAAELAPSDGAKAKREQAMLERMTGSSTIPMDVWIDSAKRARACGPA